ncbi:MAG: hypothetical protein AB7R55_01615 [Gemmatimonadales bacterium]
MSSAGWLIAIVTAASASRLCGQTAAPCAAPTGSGPGGVSVTNNAPNLTIAWNPVARAVGYAVVRRNPDGSCWAVTPQGTTGTSVQDPIPTTPGTYEYQVAVRLATRQSGLSSWVPYVVQGPAFPRVPRTRPTVMSDGPPPVGLSVTGTPTTATLTWAPASGAVNYRVNRAPLGSTAWTAVTPAPITATTVANDVLPDPHQPYTYSVLAYLADGHFGEATASFTAPPPTNPTRLDATTSGATVSLSWPAVQFAASYVVTGPGIAGVASVPATGYTVAAAPAGTATYRVGSVFNPGGLTTLSTQWTSATVQVTPPPAVCGCGATGPFTAPQINSITGNGPTGTFAHPTEGAFTVTAQLVSGSVMLDVRDSGNRVVLSVGNPAAWGISHDGRHFAVVVLPPSANTGAPIVVHRVKRGPGTWPAIVNTQAYADGWWGFSTSMFIVSRFQQGPNQFSLEAFNLGAANPNSAALQRTEVNVYAPTVTVSPCGDRLMYFRWVTLSPPVGEADFFRRTSFPSAQPIVVTDWDTVTRGTPSAAIVAGGGTNSFLVQLQGLQVRGTGQTSFPSLQCTP